ncbi:trypsin-7-like [Uranotaenia lowii]|uniref:trypsin-7-like n=1 Tax=Uranotaenia lowii TaxID=190385 RepID=UPI002478CDFB|nr:trypsin-7-like [Uranotaenia lowii]
MLIRAGSINHDRGGMLLSVAELVKHPRFDYSTKDYDCGLVRLVEPYPEAITVTLKSGSKRFPPGEMCTVTGWGKTSYGSDSKRLLKLDVPLVKQSTCREAYIIDDLTKRMLCAGYAEGGRDACQGDSGGPLLCRSVQVGIISWASGCAERNKYGVYTDISVVRKWIRNITNV